MFVLDTYAGQRRQIVDRELNKRLPSANERPAILHEAMRYSVFSGGKRLRPLLTIAAGEAVGGSRDNALLAACAIELLHTYTLIHDDLPAMDDDDERRGQPTCHIKFGEANAILAGDALLTMAFEWMGQTQPQEPYTASQLVIELAKAAGSQGVVAGQIEDVSTADEAVDAAALEYIHQHKTADLIVASCRIGAMCAGAPPQQLESLTQYGQDIGLAFQLTDDILDAGQKDNLSAVGVYGLDGTMERAKTYIASAKAALASMSGATGPLTALADFIITRTK